MLDEIEFSFKGKIWKYQGKAVWYFINLPKEESEKIKFFSSPLKKRGWGSMKVSVSIGHSKWRTSIFPDNKKGVYLLPLKADIRKKENLNENDIADVFIQVVL